MADVGIKITAIDDTKGAFGSIDRGLGGLKSAAAGVSSSLAGLASAFTVGAFVSFVKSVNDGVDALNDIKDATGASIENISALEDIAKRTGTSLDTVGSALVKLNQSLNGAKPGSDTEKALTAIGLSVKDLKNLDPAEAFRRIAVELNKFADDGNKARLSQELFGKSLKEVAPLLKDVAESGALVAKVTTEQAEAAEKFNKELFALQGNIQQVARGLVSDLVVGINAAAKAWREYGAVAGIQTLLTGDDQFKNDKQLVEQTDKLLRLEREVQDLKRSGSALDAALLRRKQEDLKVLNEQIKTTLAYRKVLAGDTVGAAAGAAKPPVALPPEVDKAALAAARAAAKAARDQAVKDEIEGFKLMQAAQDAYDKAQAESLKEREKYNEAFSKSADAVAQKVQDLEDEEAALALSTSANISLAQAIERVEIARLRERQAIELSYGNEQASAEIQREIEQRQKLATLLDSKAARADSAKAAKAAADDWQKAADQIEQSLTDALFRGFESGKSFADNLRDTLVNTFKTMVLKPMIQATVQGGLNAIGLGGSSGGALGSGLSLLSAGQGIYSAGSAYFAGGTSLANAGGAAYANATGTGINGLLATNGAYGTAAGGGTAGSGITGALGSIPIAGWIAMGMIASSEAYDKGFRANTNYNDPTKAIFDPNLSINLIDGALQSLGFDGKTAAILSGSALGAQLSDFLSGNHGYVASTGDARVAFDAQGNRTRTSTAAEIGGGRYEATLSQGADKLVAGLNTAYLNSIKQLGGSAKFTDFFYGANNSDGGKFTLGAGVGGVGGVFNSGETKLSDEAVKLAASRAVFAALQSSDLPAYLSRVLSGVAASSASQADIDAALNFAGSLKQIRDSLTETRTPLQILQDSVDAAFATLGTSAASFKTDFVAAIDAGISPEKLAEYLALGQNLEALAQASGPAAGAVSEVTRSLADIANERKGLQGQLDDLTLSSAELLAKQRDALDESNRALFDQVQAAKAAKTAAQELADAQADAARAAEDLAARAAEAFRSALATLSDRSVGLQVRLLTAQGNTAGATKLQRDTELGKLLEGVTDAAKIAQITEAFNKNSALEDFITSLEETNRAAEAAARASDQAAEAATRSAEQIKSAWQSVADSLFDEVKRIRGLMNGSNAQSFAGAQAAFSLTAAQAAAGDQNAAKLLPGLSQALLTLAEAQATSLLQLRAIQGQTAGTLEKIGGQYAGQYGLSIPKLATGTNYVPQDMLALIHQGEAVVPAAYNPNNGGSGGNAQVVAELQAMRLAIATLQKAADKTADSTATTSKTLLNVTLGGVAMQTQAI